MRPASAAGSALGHDQQAIGVGQRSRAERSPGHRPDRASSPSASARARRTPAGRPAALGPFASDRRRPPARAAARRRPARASANQRPHEELECDQRAHRVARQADHGTIRRAPPRPAACRAACAIRQKSSCPRRSDDVAHVVERPPTPRRTATSRSACGRPRAHRLLDAPPGRPDAWQRQRLAAGFADGRGQGDAVGVVDLARCRGPPRALQLVAGRQDRDAWPTTNRQHAKTQRRQHGQRGGGERLRRQSHASRRRGCRGRRCVRRRRARSPAPPPRPASSTTSIGATASAPGGIGAPVMIRTAVPGNDVGQGAGARPPPRR